jgi:DNA modification methylase
MTVQIYIGDSRQVLKTLPDQSAQCCVTSPPYYGLRDYGVDGQIGLESSPSEFLQIMVDVFREVRRVLRDDGTLWLNMGDSYSSGGRGGNPTEETSGLEGGQGSQRASMVGRTRISDLPPKNLMGMPWRLAFALQADGWILRQDIIWAKPNPMPESVRDRCTKSHEYLFLLSKSEYYYYDFDAMQEPVSGGAHPRRASNGVGFGHGTDKQDRKRERVRVPAGWATGTDRRKHRNTKGNYTQERKLAESGSGTKNNSSFDEAMAVMPDMRNKRSVWEIPTQSFKEAHFATFPSALIEPCILAGCPEGGVILDPFGGAGTSGLVADRLQRNAILIELNPEYAGMAERRIRGDASMLADVRLMGVAS